MNSSSSTSNIWVSISSGVILTSLYFFPFNTVHAPWMNSKMLLAAIGLVIIFIQMAQRGQGEIDTALIKISFLALLLSVISYVSITLNNSVDTSYLFYFSSMMTWLSASYIVIIWIRHIHGHASPLLICIYLAGASLMQCILAVTIASVPVFKEFVDSELASEGFMGRAPGRLYGIGCALDVAGSKFAAVIIIMTYMIPSFLKRYHSTLKIAMYIFTGCIIIIVGCIIARTTTIGLLLSVPVLLFYLYKRIFSNRIIRVFRRTVYLSILIFTFSIGGLYATNESCKKQIRFGFEGFFNLIEHGEWQIRSNNQLLGQFIFPTNLKTWIIGDGYFVGVQSNPYYVGNDKPSDFYKETDVGYSRLIFYFGLMGLFTFIAIMCLCATTLSKFFPEYKNLFFILLLLAFIYWAKVASDIFPVFAPFLTLGISGDKTVSPSLSTI